MDNGTERIVEDLKAIVQTRMAMAEKLGAIEQHVSSTMHHARTTMTQLAEKTTSSVRDTMLFRRGWRSTTGAVPYYPPGPLTLGYPWSPMANRISQAIQRRSGDQ